MSIVFVLSFLPLELTLPNLIHFDVTLEEPCSCTLDSTPTPVLKHLAAFIATHANTLQSVALVLPKPLDPTEIFDPLLEALSRIAHPRDLRMALPFHSIPSSKLRSLVEFIGSSLQDLRLRTRYTQAEENSALSWIRQDLPLCPFPNLRTLAVGRRLLPSHYNGAVQWLQSFGTVTKLDLRYDVPVTYKDYDYETLLQFLGSQNTIKCLRLEVPVLDSHLLTQLGYFRADLDEEALGKWTLRHLRMASPRFSRKVVKMYSNSVAECLPTLQSWTSFGRQRLVD
ncbi:uncharacterized protein LACBIDRAFT_332699 [Laccaria bicolor S238N-H82]|uniref:Predicted protein n=1 Tax=Laccaria bicolor (strain S238N-H82 / ATCC MYA-4686) TaxID=486041 RepID=B0DTL0_LACBS|nr:uncharacterized protein LACBIDRAFT_332699 [Laccaria bicolor S238N-H82]EDR02078.1 predicted protein [Laccaria bicolor S238N-H82]|eukprot:XP_001887235.1 predicted protein [Laccaria bicolor S238N-H82]